MMESVDHLQLLTLLLSDDSPESSKWENEWLQDGQVEELLAQKAVLLRLEAGSTEAGFLAAFCPLSQIPTLVVIQYVRGRCDMTLVKLTLFAQ